MSDEIKVGGLTVVAIAVLVLGFNYLKGNSLLSSKKDIYVLFENAANVSTASPVAMHGLKIGKVTETVYLENEQKMDSFNVIFKVSVKKDFNIPKGSKVEIVDVDMLGTKMLSIVPANSNNYIVTGDTLIGGVKGGIFASLEDKIDPVISQVSPALQSIDKLVNNMNEQLLESGKINQLLASLQVSLKNFEKISGKVNTLLDNQSANIEGIVTDAKQLTASLNSNTGHIDSILTNVNSLTGKLNELEFKKLMASAEKSVGEIEKTLSALNNAEGTLGKLVYEDGIYNGLDSTLVSINALIEDLMANPKRYVSFSLIERKDKSKK